MIPDNNVKPQEIYYGSQPQEELLHINHDNMQTLRRLPKEVRKDVNYNINEYIRQIGKDYPEK